MPMTAKKTLILAALAVSSSAFAQTKPPEPDYTLSYNVGVISEYRYRGISQSAKKPALQGGIDFAHKSGFYLGTWGSTIRWIKDSSPAGGPNAKGPVEIDLYGGYKGNITDTLSYDVGALEYWYVGNTLSRVTGANANTFELYGAVTYGPVTAKYSNSMTNLFGTPNSKNSGYLDISATFDVGGGFSVVPHIGRQIIHNFGAYNDYSVTVNKDFSGLVVSAGVVGTNWKDHFGSAYTLPGSGGKDLGKANLVVGVKYNF